MISLVYCSLRFPLSTCPLRNWHPIFSSPPVEQDHCSLRKSVLYGLFRASRRTAFQPVADKLGKTCCNVYSSFSFCLPSAFLSSPRWSYWKMLEVQGITACAPWYACCLTNHLGFPTRGCKFWFVPMDRGLAHCKDVPITALSYLLPAAELCLLTELVLSSLGLELPFHPHALSTGLAVLSSTSSLGKGLG